jgi:hypothetical protein
MNLAQLAAIILEFLGAFAASFLAAFWFFVIGGSIGVFIHTGVVLSGNILHGNAYSLEQASAYGWLLAVFILIPGVVGRYLLVRKNLSTRISAIAGLCVSGIIAWPIYYFLDVEQWIVWQLPMNTGFATYSLLHRGIIHFPFMWLFSKKYRQKT